MLSMTRYYVKNKSLAPWIKFIWHFQAEATDIHYKLLPTDCIDVLLSLSGSIVYEIKNNDIFAPPFHINGLRSTHSYIRQTGNVCLFGISFYPFGLYPFVNRSLAGIHDRVVALQELSPTLVLNLKNAISNGTTTENVIANIERALCLGLRVTKNYTHKAELIRDFLELSGNVTVQSFCLEHDISTKTFQRNVLRYTGYMPKSLRSIKRFQKAGNQLIHQNPSQLANVAYDNDFADQAHFIREFQKFSGKAPRTFQQEKITVKENAEYTYC